MEEKTYNTMRYVGAMNIALGIIVLVISITSGFLMIVGGGRLLKNKSNILF